MVKQHEKHVLFGRGNFIMSLQGDKYNYEDEEESSFTGSMTYRKGIWRLESNKDKRWNCSGRSNSVGGFSMPKECQEMIDKLVIKYGDIPDDLSWEYMKD
jgi:hypothetical protein